MHEIKVHVAKQKGRTNLAMRYIDPDSGKQVWKTSGTTNERKALQAAAVWEAELRDGRYMRRQRITWQEFRDQFDREYLDGKKVGTAAAYSASLNVFERKCKPGRLAEVTTAKVSAFAAMLREANLSQATIDRHLRTLKVATRWAKKLEILNKVPEFNISAGKEAKGRAITGEEFDRMVAAAPAWEFWLRGLWTSGLRLGESLKLRWDDAPEALLVDFSARRPMLRIPAESEKGGRDRLLPMAPEFAELLYTVPEARRRGYVFRVPDETPRTLHAVCRRIVGIGKAAGVIIKQKPGLGADGKPINQCASAHDLRRSFGFRWSRRVMPAVLKELMRHQSIETTLVYYVGQNAEATADELWRVVDIIEGRCATPAPDGEFAQQLSWRRSDGQQTTCTEGR
jgi:integrase